jgi:glycosyltransferase involved in cell wall biosynthesis
MRAAPKCTIKAAFVSLIMIKIFTHYYPQILFNLPIHGGPSRQLKEFQAYLDSQDHKYQLIGLTIDTDESRPTGLDKNVTEKNIFYRLGMPGLKYMEDIKTFKSLDDVRQKFSAIIDATAQIIQEEKPDVVFLNGFSWTVWLMLQAINQSRVPVVCVRSGIATKEFKIYKDFFGENGTKVLLEMEKSVNAENFYNIFLNEFSKEIYENEALGKKCEQAFIIPLSVGKDYLQTEPEEKTASPKIRIGTVARWDRIKNHQAFLNIACKADEKKLPLEFFSVTSIPETNINKEMKNEYRRLIKVLSPMPVKELINFYKNIDALLCPSHFDVSPTVVFESLLCGTPVLISENTGQKDLFQKFGIGDWVMDFSDTNKVIEKIQTIKPSQIPKNLISYLKENHSDEAVFSKYLEIIETATNVSNTSKRPVYTSAPAKN